MPHHVLLPGKGGTKGPRSSSSRICLTTISPSPSLTPGNSPVPANAAQAVSVVDATRAGKAFNSDHSLLPDC